MDGQIFFSLAVFGLMLGGLCAFIAKEKNRSPLNWFLLSALFGVFALIGIAFANKLPAEKEPAQTGDQYL